MRYQNWDVLLFPEDSKTPVQEFKTQCFVTKDFESSFLANNAFSNYPNESRLVTHLPVLTCFVPSLVHNVPFRISIHTWEKPKPSRTLENLMQPEDTVVFEARVYIDGLFICGSIFDSRSNWPQVLNTSSQLDKDGNPDTLRFPPFHQEILQQSHWDAGELLGRIRVVIAEGFARLRRTPPFERVKDVVAFSFQHAPTHVLEYSAIAWPNASMWAQAQPRQVYTAPPPSIRYEQSSNEDAHAHSPNKSGRSRGNSQASSLVSTNIQWQTRAMPPPTLPWNISAQAPLENMSDPFVDIQFQADRLHLPRWGQRSSIEDVPMPDYRSQTDSSGSRAISNMTGISYDHKRDSATNEAEDPDIAELVEALSPLKGTQAPSNTPSGDQSVSNMPKPSTAAEARSVPYGNSVGSKKEGKNKENQSNGTGSRLSSQASHLGYSTNRTMEEGVSDGKRKRPVAETPDGRRSPGNDTASPVPGKPVLVLEKHQPSKVDQPEMDELDFVSG